VPCRSPLLSQRSMPPRPELGPIVGRKKRPLHPPRDVLFELTGWTEDPFFTAVNQVMREVRAMFGTLVRLFASHVSHASAFDQRHALQPLNTGAAGFVRCELRLEFDILPWQTVIDLALGADAARTVIITPKLLADCLRTYFLHDFLGWKVTRTLEPVRRSDDDVASAAAHPWSPKGAASSGSPFSRSPSNLVIIRPYYTETIRRAGYLIGSRSTRQAVVIDPASIDVDSIVKDLEAHDLTLVTVIMTHIAKDHALDVGGLCAKAQAAGRLHSRPAIVVPTTIPDELRGAVDSADDVQAAVPSSTLEHGASTFLLTVAGEGGRIQPLGDALQIRLLSSISRER
jgi:hypothetical protein